MALWFCGWFATASQIGSPFAGIWFTSLALSGIRGQTLCAIYSSREGQDDIAAVHLSAAADACVTNR